MKHLLRGPGAPNFRAVPGASHSSLSRVLGKTSQIHMGRWAGVMQDRADIVAQKMLRLLERGHIDLAVQLNNALIADRRFKESAKLAGDLPGLPPFPEQPVPSPGSLHLSLVCIISEAA